MSSLLYGVNSRYLFLFLIYNPHRSRDVARSYSPLFPVPSIAPLNFLTTAQLDSPAGDDFSLLIWDESVTGWRGIRPAFAFAASDQHKA